LGGVERSRTEPRPRVGNAGYSKGTVSAGDADPGAGP